MDREKLDWSWMAQHVPGVVGQLREWRQAGEGDHLNECWRRGVVRLEPGWFFAREGAICIGTPWVEADEMLRGWARLQWESVGMLLVLAPLPVVRPDELMGHRQRQARAAINAGVGRGA